jgi:hypothetical protein
MRSFSIIALCCVLSSCAESEQKSFHGYLYFASGSYVGRFDLRDGSSSVVANLGDVTISNIDSLSSERLLVSMVSFAADREMPRIRSLDIKMGRSVDLFGGSDATYLSATDTIVYDDGMRLAETSLAGRRKSYVEVFPHKYSSAVSLHSISDDAVLFSIRDDEVSSIHHFDSVTKKSLELARLSSICSLRSAAWISSLERLACKVADQSYVLASLDGMEIAPLALPDSRDLLALTYVADQNVLVLAERRRGLFGGRDRWDVWVHDFAGGTNHLLAKNQYLGSSAVYLEL